MDKLKNVIELIVNNDLETLHQKHKLHRLKGKYHGLSEVHVDRQYNDNWLLVYVIHNEQLTILDLIDTGSHDQIFR